MMRKLVCLFIVISFVSAAQAQDYYHYLYEAESKVRQQKISDAVDNYLKAFALKQPNREDAYNAACLFARLKDSANCTKYLSYALSKGQGSADWLQVDPDLSFARTLSVWNRFLQIANANDEKADSLMKQKEQFEKYDLHKKFTRLQLLKDIDIIRTAIDEAHPGAYWYIDKKTFDAAWNKLKQSLHPTETVLTFYAKLLMTLDNLHDVHSETTLPNAVAEQFYAGNHFFPIPVKFINDRCFVNLKDTNNSSFAFGDEIVSIDHHPIKEIAGRLRNMIVADGYATTGKQRILSRSFFRLYALAYIPSDSVLVKYKKVNGNELQQTYVKIGSRNEAMQQYKQRHLELNDSLPARFFYTANHIPVLKVNTFNSGAYGAVNYFSFLDSVFTLLKNENASKLVLDIRQNNGGDETFLQELLSYFVDHPIVPYRYAFVKTKNFSFLPYTDDSITHVSERIKIEFQPGANGKLVRKDDWASLAPVKENVFNGKLAVLISALDVSAGSTFPSVLYQNRKNATFIGEETAGGFYGNNSSYYFQLTLPDTKIKFRLPLVQLGLNVKGMPFGHGLIPSTIIKESLTDLKNEHDAALDAAIKTLTD